MVVKLKIEAATWQGERDLETGLEPWELLRHLTASLPAKTHVAGEPPQVHGGSEIVLDAMLTRLRRTIDLGAWILAQRGEDQQLELWLTQLRLLETELRERMARSEI